MPLTEKDRELINNLLSGAPGSWIAFVDRYSGLIVQVIRHTAHAHSLKLSTEDVDDLTADVFATLLERNMGAIRGFRGRSSFATYLAVVIRRVLLRKLTQRRYLQALGHVQAHHSSIDEASESDGVRCVDARDEVDSLMQRLPESFRTVLHLFYLDGKSYREISKRVGRPINSIGPMIARARNMLKNSSRPAS